MSEDYRHSLRLLQASELYQGNLDWGKPRWGHPEGSLRAHIQALEANLSRLTDILLPDQIDPLRLLIHVHDICKPQARSGLLSDHPDNHAYLARRLLAGYCDDANLLEIVQLHDDGYALYNHHRFDSDLDRRVTALLERVGNRELYLLFVVVDACVPGKEGHALDWFLDCVDRLFPVPSRVRAAVARLRASG